MIEIIFRSILVEFLGVLTRWISQSINEILGGKKAKTLDELWSGRKDLDYSDQFLSGISNIALGYLASIVLIGLVFIVDAVFF